MKISLNRLDLVGQNVLFLEYSAIHKSECFEVSVRVFLDLGEFDFFHLEDEKINTKLYNSIKKDLKKRLTTAKEFV